MKLGDERRAAALKKDIDSFLKERKKTNRKLARDVAAWVETAMLSSQAVSESKAAGIFESSKGVSK